MRCLVLIRSALCQIVPASSNGIDAVNFRHLRDSKSLDFDDHGPVSSSSHFIRGVAGHPPASPGTPGFQTPTELLSGSGSTPTNGVAGALESEPNPFGEFSSVTKSYDDGAGGRWAGETNPVVVGGVGR